MAMSEEEIQRAERELKALIVVWARRGLGFNEIHELLHLNGGDDCVDETINECQAIAQNPGLEAMANILMECLGFRPTKADDPNTEPGRRLVQHMNDAVAYIKGEEPEDDTREGPDKFEVE